MSEPNKLFHCAKNLKGVGGAFVRRPGSATACLPAICPTKPYFPSLSNLCCYKYNFGCQHLYPYAEMHKWQNHSF